MKPFAIFILLLSLPFYNFELGRRLGLMLFIPQAVVLLIVYPHIKPVVKSTITVVLLRLVSAAIAVNSVRPKPLSITPEAYADLIELGEFIPNLDNRLFSPDMVLSGG